LLPAVQALAARLGVQDTLRKSVALRQTGRMRNDGGSGWMSFTARQTIALNDCAFRWRARTGPLGLVSVRDSFEDGCGRLNVSALGFIPIARAAGSPDVTRGELMRYLAELAWAPAAILLNRQL